MMRVTNGPQTEFARVGDLIVPLDWQTSVSCWVRPEMVWRLALTAVWKYLSISINRDEETSVCGGQHCVTLHDAQPVTGDDCWPTLTNRFRSVSHESMTEQSPKLDSRQPIEQRIWRLLMASDIGDKTREYSRHIIVIRAYILSFAPNSCSLCCPQYTILSFVCAIWNEVRLLLQIYCLIAIKRWR